MKNAKCLNKSLLLLPFLIMVILISVINTLGKNRHQLFVAFVGKDLPTFSRSKNLVCPWLRGARTFFSRVMFNILQTCSMAGNV